MIFKISYLLGLKLILDRNSRQKIFDVSKFCSTDYQMRIIPCYEREYTVVPATQGPFYVPIWLIFDNFITQNYLKTSNSNDPCSVYDPDLV